MNNVTQSIIQKVRIMWAESSRLRAIAKSRDKADRERVSSGIKLILDDMRAEGHTIDTPLGKTIFAACIAGKLKASEGPEFESDLMKGWPDDES